VREIPSLGALYKHYRKRYRTHRLFCCLGDASCMKENKDRYKKEVKEAQERLEAALCSLEQ